MLVLGEVGFLVELVLLVYGVLNIVTTPAEQVRNLPKPVWLVLVVLLPLVGGIAWLVAGRPRPGDTRAGGAPQPGRPVARPPRPPRAVSPAPDDDETFLRGLRDRAEEQRRRGDQQRKTGDGEGEDPRT